ncbi:MAG: cytochrome P460 family protein, partial [Myxococcota bacterium]
GGDDSGSGDTDASTGGDDASTGGGGDAVPTNAAELLPFLEADEYRDFPAESAVHAQTNGSPHGMVRVFINQALDDSLSAGNEAHPVGAASVKELYDGDGATLIGWAVMVKTAEDSAGGQGWYWYEILNGQVIADDLGDTTCIGCHNAGGSDLFRTNYPLQ